MADETFCPSLPSSTAAANALSADARVKDWVDVGLSVLGRAALISAGLYLYDSKDSKIIPKSLAGAAAVEVFVLGYMAIRRR